MAHDGHRIDVQVELIRGEAPPLSVLLPHSGEVVGGEVADALGDHAEARGRALLVGMEQLAVVVGASSAQMVCLEVLDCCAVLKASKWGRRSSICAPRRPRICSLMHLILGHGMGIHVGDRYHEMFLVYYGEVYYVLYIQICDLNSHSFEFRANFNPFAFNTQYFRLCT